MKIDVGPLALRVCVVIESNSGTPAASQSTLVFSRPMPSTFGARPVAAST
jgi:hypothetical protein